MNDVKGFTLVEMLVSMAIFSVITAFAVANFRAGQQGDELRISTQLVASTIRHAQTLAMAGQTLHYCHGGSTEGRLCPSGEDAECSGGSCIRDLPLGYGVRLSTDVTGRRVAIVFADTDGNHALDAGEELRRDSVSSGPFVQVSALDPHVAGTLDIVFIPPKPLVKYNGAETDTVATITLEHRQTGRTRQVTINRISGQVNAD
ncbi:hypothetical protein AMJ57_02870 [Parcubacteria bacterium SG8_24]|nr:MAG: hypothetical protein AMJ57_02870 [Parcubacteria bacterium SG8_24]